MKKEKPIFPAPPIDRLFGKFFFSHFSFLCRGNCCKWGNTQISFAQIHTRTHTQDKYIYNMYIKLDPRSPIDNCCVIEPPTSSSSSLLRWRRGISRKKEEKEITHILNGPNHTQDIQRWESGDELNKYLRKKEMRKMIEISGGNYL